MSTPAWFNKEYYLQSKLAQLVASGDNSYTDIVALDVAIQSAGFTAFTHFQSFSLVERTSPNEYFNAGEYLTAKAAQANAAAVGGRTDWTADGIALAIKDAGIATIWDHFAQFGWVEGVNPSNAFDVSDYFADKLVQLQAAEPAAGWTDASMKAAFAAAGLDPVTHYLSFGTTEGLSVTVVPEGEQVEGSTPSGEAPQTFTLTPDVDNILGAAGNDTVSGNSNTFNAGDVIDGGDGTDKLSLVLNESATAYAGVVISNIEAIELRSIASSAVDADAVVVSMSDVTGLETVSVVKSTGNTVIEDLQAGIDVIIDDVRGDVEIDFDNQNVPAAINVSVNEFGESAGGMGMSTLTIDAGVDTVNLSDDAAGAGFYNTLFVDGGFSELNVTAGANGTELNMGVFSSADELTADFTGNESDDKNIYVDMDYYQSLTLKAGDYSDDIEIDTYSYWSNDINVELGEGDNYLSIDGGVDYVTVTAGAGEDVVDTDNFYSATVNLGDGNNDLYMGDGSYLTLDTGAGIDYVSIGEDYWSDIDLGQGDNTLYMDGAVIATIVTGDGTDSVTIGDNGYWWWSGSRDLNISVGGGDDLVDLSGDYYWSSYANGLETSGNVSDEHIIAGGEGNDTLRLADLDQADADGTFANITSIETLQLDHGNYWWWGTGGGSLDGVTTGANAAGVVNYEFLYGNYGGEDITLTNVVDNVTVSMDLSGYYDNEGQSFTLTQTADTSTNVANVHFNMNDDYYWWSNDYYFGDITVDTTEVLNLSGTDVYDYYWYDDALLHFSGLNSVDLTTLNLSGDLEFNFWNIAAANLSLVDATAMTVHAEIELNDVADAITVHGGSGDDEIVLKDANSALVAHGGAGDDYIEGNMNDDNLSGNDGDDTLYAGAGVDSVYGGAGDDLILWDAAELFAVDVVDGGDDYDTVETTGSLGVQNDSFFYQWNDVEVLDLDDGNNVLTLGIIASDAGLEELYLSDNGMGTGDSIYLQEGWTKDTAIHLSNGADLVAEAPSVGVDLRVYADAYQVTSGDSLDGANGNDTLFLTADNWWWADLSNVVNFEAVVVVADEDNHVGFTTGDATIAAGKTLTVDGTAMVLGDYDGDTMTADTAGSLYVNGALETDGSFAVLGGDGIDYILTGAGDDTINAGAGNNVVEGGAGNDSISAGAGYDMILGGAGDDVIAAGDGANIIIGDGGQDQMSGGTGVDTYVFAATDAQFGNADVITGFNAGDATGVAPMDLFQTWASVNYLGYFDNATLGLLALQTNVGGIEAVLVEEIDGKYLYIDVNGDDAFSSTDAAIKLVGLTGTLDQTDFVV